MLYEARSSGWRLARPPSARPSTFGGLVCLRNVRPLDTRLAIFAKQNLVKNRLALVKELLRKCENMSVLVHKSAFWVVLKGQNTKILRFFAFLVTQGPTFLGEFFFSPLRKKMKKITAFRTLRRNRYSIFGQRSAF